MSFKYRHISVSDGSILSTHMIYSAVELCAQYARGDLLDVGCGSKPYRDLFQVTSYTGLDLVTHNRQYKDVDVIGNAQLIPFADASFDTVLSTEVIEHVPDPSLAIKEAARVLKPEGILILSTPFLHHIHEAPYDYYRFTIYALQFLIENSGLKILLVCDRGGNYIVIADLVIRTISSIVKRVSRKLRLPQIFINLLMTTFVAIPQRIIIFVESFRRNLQRDNSNYQSGQSKQNSITLGYVVVAIKPHDHGTLGQY